MASRDIDILARKLVTLERQQNANSRATQLALSSVRMLDGSSVSVSYGLEDSKGAGEDLDSLKDYTNGIGAGLDEVNDFNDGVYDWIGSSSEAAEIAWDSTDYAVDLANQLEEDLAVANAVLDQARQDLDAAELELEQAQIELTQALADSSSALQEAQDAVTSASSATAAASAAQTAAGTAQSAADQAAADALAAANAASDAQVAADDAQTTADAKGKVIIQPGAPNAADRLPQNLWIDTTGGNNTPKRWDGSDWTVVTDKAATDAAAAAVTAQGRADEAYNEALSAATAAGNAQTSADGKTTNWYQDEQPTGTGHKVGDTWFDTNDGNRVHRWDGSDWVTAQFGTNAISDTAINAAKLAANAVTEGKILNGAITNDKLDTAVQNAITTAQSTASNAQTVANSAQSVANAAQTAAGNAQDDADQAILDAAAAAGIAGGKADVLIQNTAPPAAMRKATTLWIDTTGGANTPKRWVSGTTWAAVTDKAATDAAAAAATAQSAAGAAQSRADDAHTIASGAATAASAAASAASAAQTAANNAQTTANGKNKIVRSTADASSPGNYVAGDQWWKYNGSQITAMWIHSGSAWVSQTLTDSVITNLNAGSITAGTIASARLSATNIKAVLINAGAIETANIAAGAITAASGIIADLAIGTAKIIDGSITTAKIKDLAVTNAEIANGTIQNAKIANLDAAKINTGTLNAARIGANSIDVTKLLIQGANLVPNPTFETITGWTAGGGAGPVLSTTSRGRGVYFGRSVNVERTLTSQEIYVAGETTYTVGATVLRQAGTPSPGLRLEVVPVNASGVEQTPVVVATLSGSSTSWTSIYGQYTVPASTYRSIKFRFVAGATTATSGNDYLVQPRIVQASVGEMIVDGAITATKINTNAVTADKILAGAVVAGKLAANSVTADNIVTGAITAAKIAGLTITGDKIAANAITAAKIQAKAIDGMTITGALIRTAASGQRMQFDVNGLRAFDDAGAVTAMLSSSVGGLALSGDLYAYRTDGTVRRDTTISGQGLILSRTQGSSIVDTFVIETGSGAVTLSTNRRVGAGSPPILELQSPTTTPGNSFALKSQLDAWKPIDGTHAWVTSEGREYVRAGGAWRALADVARDTAWISLGVTGWTHQVAPQVRVRAGRVEFRGLLSNNSFTGGFTSCGSLPTGIPRPPHHYRTAKVEMNSPVSAVFRVNTNGSMQMWRDGTSGAWLDLSRLSYETD